MSRLPRDEPDAQNGAPGAAVSAASPDPHVGHPHPNSRAALRGHVVRRHLPWSIPPPRAASATSATAAASPHQRDEAPL